MSDYRNSEVYGRVFARQLPAFNAFWDRFDDDNGTDIEEHGGNGWVGGPSEWFQGQDSYQTAMRLEAFPGFRVMVEAAIEAFPGRPHVAAEQAAEWGGDEELRRQFVEHMREANFLAGVALLETNNGEQS